MPIILNLLIVFIDTTVLSITFSWEFLFKHLIIPDGELFRKRKQILLLFVLIVIFFSFFIYWIPKLTTSIVFEVIHVIVLVIVVIFLTIYHLVTDFIARLAVAVVTGNDTITIDFKSKFIKKEKGKAWNKSVVTAYFDELTSLSVRPIEVRKIPYWELVLLCNEKSFQVITGDKKFLTEYANQLHKVLNLPIGNHIIPLNH